MATNFDFETYLKLPLSAGIVKEFERICNSGKSVEEIAAAAFRLGRFYSETNLPDIPF